jgi:TIR domain
LQPPVFISYSSVDEKKALALVSALEKRSIACWISKRDIKVSENYADKIPEVISKSPGFVLVYSRKADSSPEVKKELQLASSLQKTIFPIRLEDVRPTKAFQYELTTVQWIDAFDGWEAAVDKLVRGIEDISVTTGVEEVSAGAEAPKSMLPTHSTKSKLLIAAVCTVPVIGLAAWVLVFGAPDGRVVQNTVPHHEEPKWEALPSGTNFANRGRMAIPVRKAPDAASPVLVDIQPGATLYFNGVLPTIKQASINNEVWLQLDIQPESGFLLKAGLDTYGPKSTEAKSAN